MLQSTGMIFSQKLSSKKVDGGNKILVFDSLKDLPENWRDIDLKEKYGMASPDDADVQPETQSSGLSDAVSDSDEEPRQEAADSDTGAEDENVDATIHANPDKTPRSLGFLHWHASRPACYVQMGFS